MYINQCIGEAGIVLTNTTQQARADIFNLKNTCLFYDGGAGFLIGIGIA